MTLVIWKFKVQIADNFAVEMPAGAEVLSVGTQQTQPQMWALCNPEAKREPRHFHVHGTGHYLAKPPGRFVGTFQMMGGALIFHLFEVA